MTDKGPFQSKPFHDSKNGGRCPIPASIQGQVRQGFEQSGLVGIVPDHGRNLKRMTFKGRFQHKPLQDSVIFYAAGAHSTAPNASLSLTNAGEGRAWRDGTGRIPLFHMAGSSPALQASFSMAWGHRDRRCQLQVPAPTLSSPADLSCCVLSGSGWRSRMVLHPKYVCDQHKSKVVFKGQALDQGQGLAARSQEEEKEEEN